MKSLITLIVLLFVLTGSTQSLKAKAVLNHTAIFVMDLAKTRSFYSNIIGLDTLQEPFKVGKHIWYKTSEHSMLHVILGSTEKKEYYKNQHTCFSVPNMNEFVAKLNQNHWSFEDRDGVKQSVTTRVDGVHQIWLQDPDGYWIEMNDDQYK